MPALTRQAPRLLRKVADTNWARPEDHQDAYPTPSSTNSFRSPIIPSNTILDKDENDVDREPESSDEETLPLSNHPEESNFSKVDTYDMSFGSQSSATQFPTSTPTETQNSSLRSTKRSEPDSEDDHGLFRAPKRSKVSYGRNIHAPQSKSKAKSKPKIRAPGSDLQRGSSGFKMPNAPSTLRFDSTGDKASFKLPPTRTINTYQDTNNTTFTVPEAATTFTHHNSGLDEDQPIDTTTTANDLPLYPTHCPLCNDPTPLAFHVAFQAEHQHNRPTSYRWQRRFCRFHKQRRAAEVWRERGYPEIRWERLEARMRRVKGLLGDVLDGRSESVWRARLRERLRKGGKEKEEGAGGASAGIGVGFYGPRGEKVMIEWIVLTLAERIRARAADDEVVAAAGVRGGVSGFVQAVLLPHLVEQLVKQDMKLKGEGWEEKAREVIVESAELGELVHPEVEEASGGAFDMEDDGDQGDEEDLG